MDKCPNVKEVPGICDGLPVFCRGCTESVNRHTQLMSESRDEARAEVAKLKLQVREMQGHLEEWADMYGERTTLLLVLHRALERIRNWEAGIQQPGGEMDVNTIADEALAEFQKETGKKEKRNHESATGCPALLMRPGPITKCGLEAGHHGGCAEVLDDKRKRVCGFWVAGVPCHEQEPCPKHGTMPTNRI